MPRLLPMTLALCGALGLGACQTVPAPAPPAPASGTATPAPADDAFNATVWFQTAVERELVSREVYRSAGERLSAALADRTWDALPKTDRGAVDVRHLPPAIIVDVDETVLDNSPEQVRQLRAGHGFDPALFDAWVNEGRAKALA